MKWAINIGETAEAYVYYRLRSWGFDAHFANGLGSPFDIWVPSGSSSIIRIQVKGTSASEKRKPGQLHSQIFAFSTGRGGGKKQAYEADDYDIMALVALPLERAFFTTESMGKKRRVQAKKFDDFYEKYSWEKCFERIKDNQREK